MRSPTGAAARRNAEKVNASAPRAMIIKPMPMSRSMNASPGATGTIPNVKNPIQEAAANMPHTKRVRRTNKKPARQIKRWRMRRNLLTSSGVPGYGESWDQSCAHQGGPRRLLAHISELVSYTIHGQNIVRLARIRLDLFAQVLDMCVNGAF